MNWRPPRINYSLTERVFMRLLFALVIASHIPESLAHLSITKPNGLAHLVDLSFLLRPEIFVWFRYAMFAALALYVLRIGWAVVLPYLTALSIATGTINNSHGAISHSFQIVSLTLLAQTAAYLYTRFRRRTDDGAALENRVIFWSQQAIVATYFVSALTKLLKTGGEWFFQTPYVAVQIVKTTDQKFYNVLDATHRDAGLAVAHWIVAHPIVTAIVLSSGLLLELAAPVALLGRRVALAIGLSLVLFHESIQRVMALSFVWNEYLLWIYLVNVPFWLLLAARSLRSWRQTTTTTPGVAP